MAPGTKTGRIEQVNPADLTVSDNVREDTSVDDEFVNSIKENGVLQPPMVTANDSGGYEIVFGHRRTLGAIKAGLTTIDVYVVDKLEAQAARVVDQLAENQQRKQLTRAEELGGYKQLALIGLSPAQIAKRTTTNRKTVDTALAVAGNEAATKAITLHDITLDQAAVMIEFDGNKDALKKLTETAENNPGQFDHVVAEQRKKAELRAHIEQLRTELAAGPYTVLAENSGPEGNKDPGYPDAKALTDFGQPEDPFTPLEPSDLAPEQLGARVQTGYMMIDGTYRDWARIQYFVLNPEPLALTPRKAEWQRPREPEPLTPEQIAAEQLREQQRIAAAERRDAIATSRSVRTAWLKEFLQRAKYPTDVDQYITRATLDVGTFFEWELDDEVLQLAGIPVPNRDEKLANEEHINVTAAKTALDANPKLATRIMLAIIIHTLERLTGDGNFYENYMAKALLVHFAQLEAWGYSLSDTENTIRDSAIAYLAPIGDSDEDDAEPEDDTDE